MDNISVSMAKARIEVQGQTYALVERHRPAKADDSRVYRGYNSFLRIGPASTIAANLAAHSRLEKAEFPVPRIIGTGDIGDERYFIEESLGEKTYRLQFADEVAQSGEISEKSFKEFLDVMRKYLIAQAKSSVSRDAQMFVELAHIDRLRAEFPEIASAIATKSAEHLSALSVFPFVLSHGDLSPNNLFSKGVIDLEDSLPAPFGYDAVCALTTTEWYPGDVPFEFDVTPYHFTAAQKERYLAMCDEIAEAHGLPKISTHVDDFNFFRAVWLTEGMAEWPKTQKYRHDRFVREWLK